MEGRTARQLLGLLNRDAERIARQFGLRFRSIEAERANVKRRYGICYADGSIRIRLFHAVHGRPLKYSSLVNTLCHELAHLRHFNHGKRFQAFYRKLVEYARLHGIYRPDDRAPSARDGTLAQAPASCMQPPRDHARAARPRGLGRSGSRPEQLRLFGW